MSTVCIFGEEGHLGCNFGWLFLREDLTWSEAALFGVERLF